MTYVVFFHCIVSLPVHKNGRCGFHGQLMVLRLSGY
jgi:hypothetical protein